jgi:tetratricopeptide (TPR) repeat protein
VVPCWRCSIRVAVILVVVVGLTITLSLEADASQGYSRQPSLDALKRGYVATENGDYEEAYSHYKTAFEEASTSTLRFQALVGMASAASTLGRLDESRELYQQALEIRPDDADVLFSLGLVAKEQDRFQEAASLFSRAAIEDSSMGQALVELGVVYEILGLHTEAADACWRAVSVIPEDERALLCLGVARYHLQLYKGAAQAFEAVIEVNPNKPLDPTLAKDLFSRINPPESLER